MGAACSHAQERSLTTQLNALGDKPVAERVALYHAYKQTHPQANLEEEMNLYGYNLLWAGDTEEALAFFALVAAEYPTSANAYDSYAEALLALGREEESLANYEKSLALDPTNFNAEDQIERIKFPDKKVLSPEEKFGQQFTQTSFHADLDQLVTDLLEHHPNPTKFTTEARWREVLEAKKALVSDETTFAEFSWHCNALVALLNCSHSGMSGFWQENRMLPTALHFPLRTRLVEDRLYVIDPLTNAGKVAAKDEIISINGRAVNDLRAAIFDHIVSQGLIETTKRHEFNFFSTGMVAYGLGFPAEYTVEIKGKDAPIRLAPVTSNPGMTRDGTVRDCGGDLCLRYLDAEKRIAEMRIRSFNYYEWNNYDEFVRFVDVHMADLRAHGTEYLVIDVRGNGGGSPESAVYLLRYLMQQPFRYSAVADFPGKPEEGATKPWQERQEAHPNAFAGQLYFL
ncbi:MAG: S41 family peptidase, partial [Bacteroidota bacterium]